MQQDTKIPSDNPELFTSSLSSEQLVTRKLLYHLWRVDSAARSFPHDSSGQVETAMNKARWTIGLTQEMVRFSM